MTAPTFNIRTENHIQGLIQNGTLKRLRTVQSPLNATCHLEGVGEVIVLCSNNYLGLANHPDVVAAAEQGLKKYGAGTASVRFICGTFGCHVDLEKRLADLSATEAALSYVSCWCANEALIATAVGPNDVILSDELNHASIIDGCRLSRPKERLRYAHNNMDELEQKLKDNQDAEVRWVITDGVFSMEGSIANIPRLIELCHEYDAMLVVDDSHGVGVLGKTGKGTAEHYGCHGQVDVMTGTLGKALGGAAGGYVAGSKALIELLIQASRPSLFSNALSPSGASGALKAIDVLEADPGRVAKLHSNTAQIKERLTALGYSCVDSPSAIVPIHIGDEAEAIRCSERLLELGVWVVAFGYPVVPKGAARLRVQVSAALEQEHIDKVIDAFSKL
jgi:glycine C-acetyltransferase